MTTIIIFHQSINPPHVSFFVVDGNHSHLDGTYLNCGYSPDPDAEDELHTLLFDDNGNLKGLRFCSFPVDLVGEGTSVINCGVHRDDHYRALAG